MTEKIKISNLGDVEVIAEVASKCTEDVGLHDSKGQIADAKSILGMMSLDYTEPILIVSEDAKSIAKVKKAIAG